MGSDTAAARYAMNLGLPVTGCRLRVSRRARHGHIRVIDQGIIELVIPDGWNFAVVEQMIAENRQWLQQQLTLAEQRRRENPQRFQPLPERIDFRAVDECWQVHYVDDAGRARLEADHTAVEKQIVVYAASQPLRQKLLRTWFARKAAYHLKPWLARISTGTGLGYNRVFLRTQKTRWGSCSHRQNISLNRCLLFLAPELVDYLLVHELCHTLHPNHSQAFWEAVGSFIPDYKGLDRRLNEANQLVPLWVFA